MIESLADEDVLGALETFATLPPWLAAVMEPGRVAAALRRTVPELVDGRMELLDAELDRLRAKGSEWHVHCRVRVTEGGRARDFVLVGRLLPPGVEPPPAGGSPIGSSPAFGTARWRCYLEELRVQLEVEVADEALPALPSLVDATTATPFLQRSLRQAGHDAEVVGCEPQVVRYKPGSRCTIVYRMHYAGPPGPDPLVVKTHQGEKGQVAWEAMRALWATPLAGGDVLTLAEPLAYLPAERVLVQGPVPEERTLKDLAREALTGESPEQLAELREMLARTAQALAALHGSGARYGREATWQQELAEVREVLARLAGSVPAIATAADPLLRRLETVDASVPADPAVSAHHDFRPAQVLLHGGRIGFIDFDGSCPAEPALDLGRFRGKLRDIGISALAAAGQPLAGSPLEARLRLLDELCDGFLAAYRRHASVSPERVLLWEVTDLLTALLHAWTKVRLARVEPRLAVLRHAITTAPLARAEPAPA
jgi:Phosphotransferase enzyme family